MAATSVIKSWDEVAKCSCTSCRAMTEIYERCQATGEWLAIWDCRMFGEHYQAVDVRKTFTGVPAVEGGGFKTIDQAIQYVLARQKHCDAMLSSFPIRILGSDYLWRREVVVDVASQQCWPPKPTEPVAADRQVDPDRGV